jgi:hypothetical protein
MSSQVPVWVPGVPGGSVNDFDWPGVPYTDYLRQQLEGATQYEYINPNLDRRYDPVVVSGGAMHPVIQRGDVVLIDRGLKEPEDGRPVAVSVGSGRTVIGYWREREHGPVLEQVSTDKVVDLAEYPNWSVYGVVTKIIGRGISPHPPVVGSSAEVVMENIRPGQAQYILERLLRDKRITRAEVDRYAREMGQEIEAIERRIAELRGAQRSAPTPSRQAPRSRAAKKTVKKVRKGPPRGIAGTFAKLTRGLPDAERAKFETMRAKDGLKATVVALRKRLKE